MSKYIQNDVKKFIRKNYIFLLFVLFVVLSVFTALYILVGNKLFSLRIEVILVWIGIVLAFMQPLKIYLDNAKNMKYSLPEEISFFSEGFKFKTYKKWNSNCMFSDILVIFDRGRQVETSKLSKMPVSMIYYRDRKLKKVNSLMLEDSAFERVLQEYRKYLENSKNERRALVLYDLNSLSEVEYANRKGNIEDLLEKYRSNQKLEEFE